MTNIPAASLAERPETIHDFYGFPAPMYEIQYPAPGAPKLARRAAELLQKAGLPVGLDPGYGLDHGAWVPLRSIYPKADMPVTQLAIQPRRDARWHSTVGAALAPLRDEGVLVLASGGATHNLRDMNRGGGTTPKWAQDFDDWLAKTVASGDTEALLDWQQRAPNAQHAHPSDEHFLPIFVALGAGGGRAGERIHAGFTNGTLSMAAYSFDA
jgi:4,5-DOPA dioxygenase extradiol